MKTYFLKISIRGVSPMIWRRLRICGTASLAMLHQSIQIINGWDDTYLNKFRIFGKDYGVYHDGGLCFNDDAHSVYIDDFEFQLVASFKLTVSKEKYFWNYFLFTQNKSELFEKIIHKFFYFLSFLKKRQQNSITNVYVQKIFVVKFMRSRNAVNLSTYKLLISYQNGFDLFFQIVRVNV